MGGGTSPLSKYSKVTAKMNRVHFSTGQFVRKCLLKYAENGNIRHKEKLWTSVELTTEQENEIKSFFLENYGKNFSRKWHRLYQSYTGAYHKDYFPEILFSTKLEPLMNPYDKAELLCDKNLVPVLFGNIEGLHIPTTYVSCSNGLYRNSNNEYITKAEALDLISDIGDCVVKKTVDTSSGRDVMICHFSNYFDAKSGLSIKDILDEFGSNCVIQERIKQNQQLANLNETSLNTFRVMTYLLNDQVNVCPVALRLGRANADKDNMHAGGIAVGVKPDGSLRKYAFAEYGDKYDRHPDTGIIFERYTIDGYFSIVEVAKKLHQQVPYLGILSWDLSIDDEGVPVLIEMNPIRQGSWLPQMVNGEPLFGKDTEEILDMIKT